MAKPTWQNDSDNMYRALTGGNSNHFDLDRAVRQGVDWVNRKFAANLSSEKVLAFLKENPNLNQYQAAKRVYDIEKDK